ncbi:TPA: hypothetical protein DEP94_04110 [Candidatus Nomurabacteria bacterium]|nr:hypothetical protein [Candidatus Nomurabacteria bacterium]
MWTIKNYLAKILGYLFPSCCYICKKEGETICDKCIKTFPKNIDILPQYIISVFSFRDEKIKNIIHAIKYYHRKDLIKPLARELAKKIQDEGYAKQESNELTNNQLLITNNCVLIPIPMPTIRKYMRGYNQSELIAKEISEILSIPMNTKLLVRSRNTKRQVKTFNKAERMKNQCHSFKIIGDVSNLNIILIDDVTTTGATISEARNILLEHKAREVQAITIAH